MIGTNGASEDSGQTLQRIAGQLVVRLATLSCATESALFAVEHLDAGGFSLHPLVYGYVGEPTKRQSNVLNRFKDAVRAFIERKHDGCVYLGQGAWCVVALLQERGAIGGAIATITRSGSRKVVQQRLMVLQGQRPARRKRGGRQ